MAGASDACGSCHWQTDRGGSLRLQLFALVRPSTGGHVRRRNVATGVEAGRCREYPARQLPSPQRCETRLSSWHRAGDRQPNRCNGSSSAGFCARAIHRSRRARDHRPPRGSRTNGAGRGSADHRDWPLLEYASRRDGSRLPADHGRDQESRRRRSATCSARNASQIPLSIEDRT
jgi:hypothetical protein